MSRTFHRRAAHHPRQPSPALRLPQLIRSSMTGLGADAERLPNSRPYPFAQLKVWPTGTARTCPTSTHWPYTRGCDPNCPSPVPLAPPLEPAHRHPAACPLRAREGNPRSASERDRQLSGGESRVRCDDRAAVDTSYQGRAQEHRSGATVTAALGIARP
jgi:hypothetical protein